MVRLEEAVIARLETRGERFEILVDPDLALELKHGKDVDFEKLLAVDTIFKDARRGDKASQEHAFKLLGVSTLEEAVRKIIRKGEIQLTTEQRRKMQEQRRRQIVNYIARHAINPQTGVPHPARRIEKALEEAKVNIDIHKSAEEQIPAVVKALRPLLPLKFEERRFAVKVPPEYAAKAYSVVAKFGKPEKEEWLGDGSWAFVMKLPAGAADELFRELNALTRGEFETRMLR
ncbi:MAG: ribosome assembly factor SBDS [Euryarchaeota archaeon]|nr:ribosome assembly factor SBDS [Euryarchaeota archaeon]